MAKRSAPEVNAGSMADIAFLLLIFFLVTTDIAVDSGLSRKLPPIEENQDDIVIKQKNIFALNVNANNQLFLKAGEDEKLIELKDLRALAVKFLDNGGGTGKDACKRCRGAKDPKSSDNFQKAIISLSNDRLTKYKTYIAVQNEILAAYNELRNREFKREYPKLGMNFVEANDKYQDAQTKPKEKEDLKEKLEAIKLLVPQKFSEAETKNI
ncbi:biopolymer transporter ExbD [Lacinutrix sp. 5H-3-7-4]|uniref:ExbD/TolR family protein n=1 Tax=Lacinutrix sp. (strain 5H-3-7-4) TaxID=983544 RepID=UPI00020A3CA0|nr:biopolymer transporter ExbD [Lacinutrix sp. 5H-3-7-4]AEH00556.1 Biopolymer transport protein ExbD/TolR [Lacinutrix sp. 5H-3-7-4]